MQAASYFIQNLLFIEEKSSQEQKKTGYSDIYIMYDY